MINKQLLGRCALALSLGAAGCSSSASTTASTQVERPATTAAAAAAETESAASSADVGEGIRLVSASEGAAIAANPPEDLVILDVRTPEEFTEGRLDGAIMVDFYEPDFADQLADLDPDVPYLLYCRSGNRSGQTAAMMEQLGFANVADIDGGIISWGAEGHPMVTG